MDSISNRFVPTSWQRQVRPQELTVNYGDGVNSLLEVALLPDVDSVVSNCMTLGGMAPPFSQFSARISQAGCDQYETVEARHTQAQTTSEVEGNPVRVESNATFEGGIQVRRGQVESFQFETRSGFDEKSGVYFNEGFIVRGVSGEQIDFRREMKPLPDRSGTEFRGHIGGLPEQGTIKMDASGLSIERQIGDYQISGTITTLPTRPPLA